MKLSITMLECLALMKENGGKIVRFPGGFWAQEGWNHHGQSFGSSTIEAMISRGLASYTAWQKHGIGIGKFPVEATLLEKNP